MKNVISALILIVHVSAFAQEDLDGLNKKELKEIIVQERYKSGINKNQLEAKKEYIITLEKRCNEETSIYKSTIRNLTSSKDSLMSTSNAQQTLITDLKKSIDSLNRAYNKYYAESKSVIAQLKLELDIINAEGDTIPSKSQRDNINRTAPTGKIMTYSGSYSSGEATYQYYENTNGERVYHGSFTYKGVENQFEQWKSDNYERFQFNYPGIPVCKGGFNHDKKSGPWKYALLNNYSNESDTFLVSYGNYSEGEKEGKWRYYSFLNTEDNKTTSFDFTMTYSNGKPVGKFNFNWSPEKSGMYYNDYDNSPRAYKVTGQFASDGLPAGNWVSIVNVRDIDFEIKETFVEGRLVKYSSRDLSTGKILSSKDVTQDNPNGAPQEKQIKLTGYNDIDITTSFLDFINGLNHSENGPFYSSLDWMFDKR